MARIGSPVAAVHSIVLRRLPAIQGSTERKSPICSCRIWNPANWTARQVPTPVRTRSNRSRPAVTLRRPRLTEAGRLTVRVPKGLHKYHCKQCGYLVCGYYPTCIKPLDLKARWGVLQPAPQFLTVLLSYGTLALFFQS